MAYEYDEFVDAMRFGLTMSDRETTDPIWNMVDEVVNKAKAFDRLVELYPQKDEIPSDEFFDEMEYIIKESADDER